MGWISKIREQPQRIKWSQNGEEFILDYILDHVGIKHKYLVDIGANNGYWLSNTRLFMDRGWKGLLVDCIDADGVTKWFVTKENIISLMEMNNVPKDFDILNIDLDSNDYWVLDEILTHYKPSVICSEYNSEHDPHIAKTIPYDIDFRFDGYSDWYGYTYAAGKMLAAKHGYTIIYTQSNLNLFYLRNDLMTGDKPNYNVEVHRWWGGVNPNAKWVML